MIITQRIKKRKVGVHKFRRKALPYYKNDWKKEELMTVLRLNWNNQSYSEFKSHLAQVLHIRKESEEKNLPIVITGDAQFPPLPFEIERYYLNYNSGNFIGEYEMMLYGENTFLIFHLHYPEDFDRYKEIAHRIVYLGSLCKIVFACSNEVSFHNKRLKKEGVTDYKILIMKDTDTLIPCHKTSKPFEFKTPVNF
jgi:hypothetical protein